MEEIIFWLIVSLYSLSSIVIFLVTFQLWLSVISKYKIFLNINQTCELFFRCCSCCSSNECCSKLSDFWRRFVVPIVYGIYNVTPNIPKYKFPDYVQFILPLLIWFQNIIFFIYFYQHWTSKDNFPLSNKRLFLVCAILLGFFEIGTFIWTTIVTHTPVLFPFLTIWIEFNFHICRSRCCCCRFEFLID